MYSFKLSDLAESEFNNLANRKSKSGLVRNLKELIENPLKKAINVPFENLGEYYINAGNKYCIIFNIDEDRKIIEVMYIKRQAFLYKILKG